MRWNGRTEQDQGRMPDPTTSSFSPPSPIQPHTYRIHWNLQLAAVAVVVQREMFVAVAVVAGAVQTHQSHLQNRQTLLVAAVRIGKRKTRLCLMVDSCRNN